MRLLDEALADSGGSPSWAGMDPPGSMITSKVVRSNGRQLPISFKLAYDEAYLDPNTRYVIRVRIIDHNRLLFYSNKSYPVITLGHSNSADIMVKAAPR